MSAPELSVRSRRLSLGTLAGLGRTRDFLLTFGTEFGTLACMLLALKLAAARWDTAGFGEYVLARRTLNLLQLPLLGGMGLAVTRYVARAHSGGDRKAELQFFVAGILIVFATLTVACLVFAAAPRAVSRALFGQPSGPLLGAVAIATAGLVVHGLGYGMLRGRLSMVTANLLQAVNLGLLPLLVLAWPGWSVPAVLAGLGSAWLLTSGATIAAVVRSSGALADGLRGTREAARALLWYGLPRVPGEFALGALFALPVTFAAHRAGAAEAGFVGLGISLLSMAGSLFAPLGQIVLPTVSRLAATDDRHRIASRSWRLAGTCVALALGATALGILLAPLVIPRFLGAEFMAAVPGIQLLLLGLPPYVVYIVLRAVLDAVHTRPLNAKNLLIALGSFAVIALAGHIAASLAAALWLLGGLTVLDAHRAFARMRQE
jgi:O-antigen/teichoic acid export membrane protein